MSATQRQPVDLSKPVQTRDGQPVRILCTDRRGVKFPVFGLMLDNDGFEYHLSWDLDGNHSLERSPYDLVNVPVKLATTRTVNFYRMGHTSIGVSIHANRSQADREALSYVWPRIACKEITFEATDGEGL